MTTHPRTSRSLKISWKALLLPFGLFLILPLLALFLQISPADLVQTFAQEQVTQALSLSMVTSLTTVLVTIAFGTPVAYYLSHPRYRFHRLVDTLVDLPTVLPPAVAGVALLAAFGRRGLLGAPLEALGISLPFTQAAVVMAQTFIAAPFYIKSAALGFAAVDCELRKAAALDGASRWQTFRYIIVPMAWAALLSGAVMTWARALGEFGATIIFAGNFPGRTQTMPLAIYIGFEIDLNVALTLAIVLVCLAFLILAVVKAVVRSQIEINPNESDY
jgi:molybdate transport system permease protein